MPNVISAEAIEERKIAVESFVRPDELSGNGKSEAYNPFENQPDDQPIEPEAVKKAREKRQAEEAGETETVANEEEAAQTDEAAATPAAAVNPNKELVELLQRERKETEEKIQKAYERGVAEGEKRRNERDNQLGEQYAYGLEKLKFLGKSLETQARHEALEIALMVAKKIIQQEIVSNPLILIDEIKKAANSSMGRGELTIRLHPDDLARVNEKEPELADKFSAVAMISVIDDDSLELGDCIIDTDMEQINMTLDEQLKELKRALEESIE